MKNANNDGPDIGFDHQSNWTYIKEKQQEKFYKL